MINDIHADAKQRMQKSIEAFQHELTKLRTGRANPSMIENVKVDYYGTETPLQQLASIGVETQALVVQPWDKGAVAAIEKAITMADLGLNPASKGDVIRVPIPPLTEERRKELIRHVKTGAEQARVAIRNIRRDANQHLKELLKEKDISEDEERRAQDQMQKLTDQFVAEADQVASKKEQDLLEI